MNAKSIAVVGVAAFLLVLLLSIFIQFMFLCISAATVLFLIVGFWIGPRSKRELKSSFEVAAEVGVAGQKKSLRVLGKTLSVNKRYELLLKLDLKNRAALIALLLVTFGGVVAYLSRNGLFDFVDPDSALGVALLGLGYLTLLLCIPAFIWLEEALLIRSGVPVFALIEARLPHWLGTTVRYYFKDFSGEHSGGYARDMGASCAADDLAVVIYSRTNPQFSKPSFAFWFHEIRLDIPNEQT